MAKSKKVKETPLEETKEEVVPTEPQIAEAPAGGNPADAVTAMRADTASPKDAEVTVIDAVNGLTRTRH